MKIQFYNFLIHSGRSLAKERAKRSVIQVDVAGWLYLSKNMVRIQLYVHEQIYITLILYGSIYYVNYLKFVSYNYYEHIIIHLTSCYLIYILHL